MKTSITLFIIIFVINNPAIACSPLAQNTKPPRLVNGEWVQDKPSDNAINKYEILNRKHYSFVFSGIYTKEINFSNKRLSYIETKKIWLGSVAKNIELSIKDLPSNNNCEKMKFNQEYIFFGTKGGRQKPIILKQFRLATPEIKKLLGNPTKQWLRGRLIHSNK